MKLIRFTQVPVNATFKYNNKLYRKTRTKATYQTNCVKLEDGKEYKLHGCTQVELINRGDY